MYDVSNLKAQPLVDTFTVSSLIYHQISFKKLEVYIQLNPFAVVI